jgi:hypothetical protein
VLLVGDFSGAVKVTTFSVALAGTPHLISKQAGVVGN